ERSVFDALADGVAELRLVRVAGGEDSASVLSVEEARLVEEGLDLVEVVDDDVDVAGDEPPQPLRAGAAGGAGRLGRLGEEPRPFLHDLDEQVLFGGDVRVQGRAEQAELLAQVTHRGAVVAALCEQSPGGGDDVLSGVAGRGHRRLTRRSPPRSRPMWGAPGR